jgi:hypothetical protein
VTETGYRFGVRNTQAVEFNRQHEASTRETWVQDNGTAEVGGKGGKACKEVQHACRSSEGQ